MEERAGDFSTLSIAAYTPSLLGSTRHWRLLDCWRSLLACGLNSGEAEPESSLEQFASIFSSNDLRGFTGPAQCGRRGALAASSLGLRDRQKGANGAGAYLCAKAFDLPARIDDIGEQQK